MKVLTFSVVDVNTKSKFNEMGYELLYIAMDGSLNMPNKFRYVLNALDECKFDNEMVVVTDKCDHSLKHNSPETYYLASKLLGHNKVLFGTQSVNMLSLLCYGSYKDAMLMNSGQLIGTVGNIKYLFEVMCLNQCPKWTDSNFLLNNFYKQHKQGNQLIQMDTNQVIFNRIQNIDSYSLCVMSLRRTAKSVNWMFGLGYLFVLPIVAFCSKRFPLWLIYYLIPAYMTVLVQKYAFGCLLVPDTDRIFGHNKEVKYTYANYIRYFMTYCPFIYTALLSSIAWRRRCEFC